MDFGLFFFWLFWSCAFLNFSGYLCLLALIRILRPLSLRVAYWWKDEAELPPLCVVIPTYREELLLKMKLQNIASLDYPRSKLRVIVADGQSEDRTTEIFREFAAAHPELRLELLVAKTRGKVHQLNEALAKLGDDYFVVISDADAEIQNSDALKQAVAYLGSETGVGLVGGWSAPSPRGLCFDADPGFWDKQNRLRHMETVCFSSSIVVAPFYAFRRNLIQAFPEDCIADDVYISFQAHLQEKRVIYAPDIQVTEHRQATNLRELFLHKHWKGLAFLTELFRIANQLPHMGKRVRLFFSFKFFQITILPWTLLGLAGFSLRLCFLGEFALVAKSFLVLLATIGFASWLMTPPKGMNRGGITLQTAIASGLIFSMMLVVLLVNFFVFPFQRKKSSFRRLHEQYS